LWQYIGQYADERKGHDGLKKNRPHFVVDDDSTDGKYRDEFKSIEVSWLVKIYKGYQH